MASTHKITTDDIIRLMAGMSANRIGALEFEGLKLVASRPESAPLSAGSMLGVPAGVVQQPEPTDNDAVAAIQKAKDRMREMSAKREADMSLKKAQLSGGGGPMTKALKGIMEEAKLPKPM